ncbi:hypothetical protein B0186_08205 [Canicola haemoglobinophilus]|uniref:Uncharacterized protein n=1 Tax=Canicola haemoglobinophilus TaxID=733 RepID=A0A1V4AZZ7_9PAST|nr:hypothetical protein [Canicola haemoglobinophilus]OOR99115.1 hypothetical protein B0186_08205 [Canicola haemoglobinophilus]STO58814.1 Uncharacterised protein [Canicola haemoglobinophilus]
MFEIECPHCRKNNKIRLPENAECRHCKNSLDEYRFSSKSLVKPILATSATALFAGSVIGYVVEDRLDIVRYRPELEFAIISQCSNSGTTYLSKTKFERYIRICSCALEKTMKEIGYKNTIDNELSIVFGEKLSECK